MMTLHYKKEKELASQLQETSRKLEEVNEELKRKDRIKDEFVSIASHELRTPVQSILGFADLAKENLIDQREAWNGVIEAALRLQKVAKDILDVSRIQSGQLSYNM
jgi:signal transduction histidine kinase